VEAVVETLAAIHHHGESVGELAHDARNMVTALSLYCDLLEEPGVLTAAHRHYGSELRLVAEASRRLVEKLARLDEGQEPGGETLSAPSLQASSLQASSLQATSLQASSLQGTLFPAARRPEWPAATLSGQPTANGLIDDLRAEVLASCNLLAAIAGPAIRVSVEANGGASPVEMSGENLVRALVNLVKNAAESISGAGAIRLALIDRPRSAGETPCVILSIEDNGGGIAEEHLDRIFEPGFTARPAATSGARWESGHRGLGLAITRSIVEAAGGRIHAEKRSEPGARFVIELPVRTR
jgi:signal transduction histidine kinase